MIGKEWIKEFVNWGFKPYSPTKTLLESYIYYWSLNRKAIPRFFKCPQINHKYVYPGKIVILTGMKKNNMKIPDLKHLCPLSVTFNIPGGTFFLQEEAPFYLLGLIKAIYNKRLR